MTTIYWRLAALVLAASSSIFAQGQNQIGPPGIISISLSHFQTLGLPVVAPGTIVTLFTTALNVPDAVAAGLPLPTSLSGVSVGVRVIGAADIGPYPTSLPILRINNLKSLQNPGGGLCPAVPNSVFCARTQITVEIPTEGVCAPTIAGGQKPKKCDGFTYMDLPPLLVLNVNANGATSPDMLVQVAGSAPQLLNSCDPILTPTASFCHDLVTHADGTPVTDRSPARVGEVITIYAVGFGSNGAASGKAPTSTSSFISYAGPSLNFQYSSPLTGYPYVPGVQSLTTATIAVIPDWLGVVPGYVGLYQVNIRVPPSPDGTYQPCFEIGGVLFNGNANIVWSFPGSVAAALPSPSSVATCVQP